MKRYSTIPLELRRIDARRREQPGERWTLGQFVRLCLVFNVPLWAGLIWGAWEWLG